MTTFNEKEFRIGTAEYDRDFWDTMRGSLTAVDNIHCGVKPREHSFFRPAATRSMRKPSSARASSATLRQS